MADLRNVAHDKKVQDEKKKHGEAAVPDSSETPQPGKKPPLIDADTGPSNSVAHQMYKDGEQPRVHVDAPESAEADADANNT